MATGHYATFTGGNNQCHVLSWNIPLSRIWNAKDSRADGRIENPWSFLHEFDRWWRFEVKVIEVMQAKR